MKLHRFTSESGYVQALTAVLAFDLKPSPGTARRATIRAVDPTAVSTVTIGRAEFPLAADYSAPIIENSLQASEFRRSISGLFNADRRDATLVMLEPYDPQRIPVVLVHGLKSHTSMWRDPINDLRADPELRGRYQFWIFGYPSGWPIAYSAMRLREELAAVNAVVGRQRDLVLISHSMGGLLSRMQTISPGKGLWNMALAENAVSAGAKLPSDNIVKRCLLFDANPGVKRIVFIAVPHRGSDLADLSLAAWVARLIHLPGKITRAVVSIPGAVLGNRPIDSINGLSTSNPLYGELEKHPIQAPHHSIIGDRGKGGNLDQTEPVRSDGVVPYWSAHLASAQSELIVPSDHGAYDDPESIAELKRILKLHLRTRH